MGRWQMQGNCTIVDVLLGALVASGSVHAQANDQWQFEATPYLWAAGMKGDVGVGNIEVEGVEVTFPDIMKSLRAGFMGSLEGRKDRFGFFADAIYMQLHQTHPAPRGFLGDVDAKVTQQVYSIAGSWRVDQGGEPIDLFAGVRTNYIKVNLDLSSSAMAPAGRTVDKNRNWADGFVGARIQVPIDARWRVVGYGDFGAGGSDSTWQVLAAVDYAMSPAAAAKFGYRYIKVDYHKDDFLYDMASGGFFAGVGLRF